MSQVRGRIAGLAWLVGLGFGCGPTVDPPEDIDTGASTEDDTGPGPGSTDDGPLPTTTTTAGTDDGPLDGGYEDDDGGTGCTFTCPPPPPPPPPPGGGGGGGGGSFECSLEEQNCPEGEKCMPWANDGGTQWNATRCSPIDDTPDGLDEPCVVEGNAYSGIDSCELGLMCFEVDPRTNEGTCSALCGLPEPVCTRPDEACATFGSVSLCVSVCDPVAMSPCPMGEGCFVTNGGFYCADVSDMPIGQGQPCPGPYTCDAGLLCAYGFGLDCGAQPGEGCCAAVCDATDPGSCPGGPAVTCEAWFTVDPPPQWAHVGVCVP